MEQSAGRSYIEQFLSLKCAGDVLNCVHPMSRGVGQISEAMALIRRIRRYALRDRGKIFLAEFCAGNGLPATLAAHLLPFCVVGAFDKQAPTVRARDLSGDEFDVRNATADDFRTYHPTVIIARPHKDLASHVVRIYNELPNAIALAMIPHGVGKNEIRRGHSVTYVEWAAELALRANGDFYVDDRLAAPSNIVVWAEKESR